jgi:hypothetical protein
MSLLRINTRMKKISLALCQLILLSIMLFSCGGHQEQDYAIKDSRDELRPLLEKIVDRGWIEKDSTTERFHIVATNQDLAKLVRSEHPLIRSTAILEKLRRDSLADNDFLEQHLADTAIIISKSSKQGGWEFTTVADIMLYYAEWASDSLKMIMAREVILRHNNLSAAFLVLGTIDPDPGLYSAIRDMAAGNVYFGERQEALFALAAYRKKEDVSFLQKILNENTWGLSERSFELMHKYPDTSYLTVLEKFIMRRFVDRVCRDERDFYEPVALNCLASYKEPRSAMLLSKLWNMKTPNDCNHKWGEMKRSLLEVIWENKCESYAQLLKTTSSAKKDYDKHTLVLGYIPRQARDPEEEKIRWQ